VTSRDEEGIHHQNFQRGVERESSEMRVLPGEFGRRCLVFTLSPHPENTTVSYSQEPIGQQAVQLSPQQATKYVVESNAQRPIWKQEKREQASIEDEQEV